MTKKEEIELEIKELESLKRKTNKRHADKRDAFEISSELGSFKFLVNSKYKHGSKYFPLNGTAEIDITDAIEDLDYYSNSKLKRKDDHYFYSGIKKCQRGLEHIIWNLKQELSPDS